MTAREIHRPADICRALLAALDAAEGRRRRRKRDQTPDAIGLSVKRDLLERVVADDPPSEQFEEWLLDYPESLGAPELVGPARAMARAVFDEWQLAHTSDAFRRWLAEGAPSEDSERSGANTSPRNMPDAAGIILAGGRSSRMGRPKALLPFGERPLIAHVLDVLTSLFGDVVVVAAPDQELPSLPARIVRDEIPHQGPVGGLCYGLAASTREINFVTSCDSVFLNPALITYLVAQIEHNDVVVPSWGGRLQPLHAVYRRGVLPLLREQLARGELRPVTLYDSVRTRKVSEAELRQLDPEGWSFFNMNTPADYEQALSRWQQQASGSATEDAWRSNAR